MFQYILTNLFDDQKFIFYENEYWKLITSIDGIKPIYYISTHGRIYNSESNHISIGHKTSNGYMMTSFYKLNGSRVWAHIHRIMMLAFAPIANPELFVVNHINGIKTDNFLWNLEWVTQKGNIKHAFDMGLRGVGENSSNVVFTNEQVHKVCKCMEDGMNIHQLSKFVFGTDPDQQIISLCSNIYSGKFWREISCKYNIKNYKRNMIFSEIEVEKICEILQRNKNASTGEILDGLGYFGYSKDQYEIFNRAIRSIRIGKSFKNISKKYNI